MEHIWKLNNPHMTRVPSSEAYRFLQNHLDSKSRASVILFLNQMVYECFLEYKEESGKGRYPMVYYPKMDREQFAKHVIETITDKLNEVLPQG